MELDQFKRKSISGFAIREFIRSLEAWDQNPDTIMMFNGFKAMLINNTANISENPTLTNVSYTSYYLMHIEATTFLRKEFDFNNPDAFLLSEEFDSKVFKGNRILRFIDYLDMKLESLRRQADWLEENQFTTTFLHAQNNGTAQAIFRIKDELHRMLKVPKEFMIY